MPIALGILIYIVLLLSLTVHEFAHAFTADRCGDDTPRVMGRLTLNPIAHIDLIGTLAFPLIMIFTSVPLFGWAKPVPVSRHRLRNPSRHHMLVAAAGPVSNFMLCALCIALYRALVQRGLVEAGEAGFAGLFLGYAAILNAALGAFNLVPIPPLDGSRVMAELLPPRLAGPYHHFEPFGGFLLLGLLMTGLFGFILAPVQALVAFLMHAPL